ncbi:TetR/AcrR family transcriptional regulator [Nocardia sp. 348MFTsu5.1]|uniref:TetR/AcrR family transcriptional regulator n=1 Tax=Nocardia sp. 348MFTsu5.1 TaxID=1172185 RepID=UPI000370EF1A|nr:TetR/AcrR family transcriptional regulator [Nocardia sp. 348MFTsu5.1]
MTVDQPSAAGGRSSGRRAEIISAAADFFAKQGFHTVGMREIAEAVGIRGASLYNHFSSKEEIMYAIALRMTRDLQDLHMPLLDAAGTPKERLANLMHAHIRSLADHQTEHLVSLREQTALTPEHLAEITDIRKYYQRRVRDVIAAGIAAGEFGVANPHQAAVAILDMMNGISWWLNDGQDVGALADTYTSYAIDGVLQSDRV